LSYSRNFKSDNLRISVANEAARIIQEQGLSDFRSAKEKAIERLGLKSNGALPSNQEIEQALAERNRIFKSESHPRNLQRLRVAALKAMNVLNVFDVLLVGPVLSGNITEHSRVDLHLFTDAQETVGLKLSALGIRHRSVQIRQQFKRRQFENYTGYLFSLEDSDFSATVFPQLMRRYSPLSLIDGKPMRRAGTRAVACLLSA
jgi:hypothetical protein